MTQRGGKNSSSSKISMDVAETLIHGAAKAADDVIKVTQSDPSKKKKSLKATTMDDMVPLVSSGDPSNVLSYIKSHKKDFVSGVFMSVFMSSLRKLMADHQDGSAESKKKRPLETSANKPSKKVKT